MKIAPQKPSSRERGAVLVMVAAATVVLLLAGAIAVDLSAIATRGQTLQNTADSAALAGVEIWAETGSQNQARDAVAEMLAANGVGNGDATTSLVTFPSATQLDVLLTDSDPEVLLGGPGIGGDLSRGATAEYEICDSACSYEVEIPPPFASVEAVGAGDGYKPIPVDNKLYALHHDGTDIVCVDRITQSPCWSPISRTAYAGSAHSSRSWGDNPHMPHAVVVGSRIWWSTTDTVGHKLFCWETITDTPCATSYLLAALPETNLHNYESNRGGATTLVNGLIYVFTDDHRAHCFDPGSLSICAGYAGGRPTGLGVANFPAHDPADGNHGSSQDRVLDETTGRIYTSMHINTAVGYADCSTPLTDPSGQIVFRNVATNQYIRVSGTGSSVRRTSDGTDDRAWWIVDETSSGIYTFESVDNGRYMDADNPTDDLFTSSSVNNDDHWQIIDNGSTVSITNDYRGGWVSDYGGDMTVESSHRGLLSEWHILPYQCGNPFYVPPVVAPTLPYERGTWVQCFDAISGTACLGFTPHMLHTSPLRSSGRLWFYRSNLGIPEGLCSSGFDGGISQSNFEVECVDILTGDPTTIVSTTMTNVMQDYRDDIATTVSSSLSSWGDPHWNEASNRVFFPSHHNPSKVFCWDWDDNASCGQRRSFTTNLGDTEDYGYFSEGNCVYGLGHNSIFWAFSAENIDDGCTGSTATTTIQPCNCGTELAWGTIDFNVDLPLFNVFDVQIRDPDGNIVFPPDADLTPADDTDDWHSLIDDGTVVDLRDIPTTFTHLEVVVQVESDHDPWASGHQTFFITFAQSPHLVD